MFNPEISIFEQKSDSIKLSSEYTSYEYAEIIIDQIVNWKKLYTEKTIDEWRLSYFVENNIRRNHSKETIVKLKDKLDSKLKEIDINEQEIIIQLSIISCIVDDIQSNIE